MNQHFAKNHFWTFPPVQFSTIVKTPVFESFNTWSKNNKHASFWTFRPPNVLWVDTNLRKLQICVPIKDKEHLRSSHCPKLNLQIGKVYIYIALIGLQVDTVRHINQWCPPRTLCGLQPGSEFWKLPRV